LDVSSPASSGSSHRQEINCASTSIIPPWIEKKTHQLEEERLVAEQSQLDKKIRVRTKKRCSHKECTYQAKMGGACITHGSKKYVYLQPQGMCQASTEGGESVPHIVQQRNDVA
jgi:hypothetical protein